MYALCMHGAMMQTTMNLLDAALQIQPAPYWTERLSLARTTLHTAKSRGHLSPAIAGALPQSRVKDRKECSVLAALESERDSACKSRMLKRIAKT